MSSIVSFFLLCCSVLVEFVRGLQYVVLLWCHVTDVAGVAIAVWCVPTHWEMVQSPLETQACNELIVPKSTIPTPTEAYSLVETGRRFKAVSTICRVRSRKTTDLFYNFYKDWGGAAALSSTGCVSWKLLKNRLDHWHNVSNLACKIWYNSNEGKTNCTPGYCAALYRSGPIDVFCLQHLKEPLSCTLAFSVIRLNIWRNSPLTWSIKLCFLLIDWNMSDPKLL